MHAGRLRRPYRHCIGQADNMEGHSPALDRDACHLSCIPPGRDCLSEARNEDMANRRSDRAHDRFGALCRLPSTVSQASKVLLTG